MSYKKQVSEVVNYFKNNEKNIEEFKIGCEFEHFIVDKSSLRTINYYEENGVKDTLHKLLTKGWKILGGEEVILSLIKDNTTITLEPGAQIELSIKPHINIKEIENEYKNFLNDITPILENNNQALISIGYHPVSKIEDIPFIPKKRYEYMSDYFSFKGKYALNMMKGTCSTQVTIDFKSEEDFIKKFRVSNVLTTIVSAMFDNSPIFEGEVYKDFNLRSNIWKNCDLDRCGVIKNALDYEFGYNDYAKYILDTAPILIRDDDIFKYTKNILVKDLFDPDDYAIEDLEHILTMVFPDVRAKKFIEVRMADSVPYPLNMSIIALLKGLLYDEGNLNYIYDYLINITNDDIEKSKEDIIEKGYNSYLKDINLFELGKKIINLAKDGLNKDEIKYITLLEKMFINKKTPALITKEELNKGKNKALSWCIQENVNMEVK